MGKHDKRTPIKPLVGGAKHIREPVNDLIADNTDDNTRICDLETDMDLVKMEPISAIVNINGILHFLEMRGRPGPVVES